MAGLIAFNSAIWADWVLYVVLGTGILFTVWSGFGQYYALTHGTKVVLGHYDNSSDPGAISHFQALSAALSATVGLGNIGGVAVAISLGGPGAVFWMWIIGVLGMALKTGEVTLTMLYRNTDDPLNPHGGPMYVADRGGAEMGYPRLGKAIACVFCLTLLVSTITGGNMFQAWNVAAVTELYFGVPRLMTGLVLGLIVAAVILGGIQRIGQVTSTLVPFMCGVYMLAAIYVLLVNISAVPDSLRLIVVSAFAPAEAQGAFIGGTALYAFSWGLKRALYSSEAGQGSSPMAHAAARTQEPVREAVVAGLEPFIDTLVVCTLTALVILTTGIWSRPVDIMFPTTPQVVQEADGGWTLHSRPVTPSEGQVWRDNDLIYTVLGGFEVPHTVGRTRLGGVLRSSGGNTFMIEWETAYGSLALNKNKPELMEQGAFVAYPGSTLTARAFDLAADGLGKWLITFAAWLFAISTIISWNYYGEQGIVYLLGERWVVSYRILYCTLVVVACAPWLIRTNEELDAFTNLGTGLMLWANIPIMLVFSSQMMRAYHSYIGNLRDGKFI